MRGVFRLKWADQREKKVDLPMLTGGGVWALKNPRGAGVDGCGKRVAVRDQGRLNRLTRRRSWLAVRLPGGCWFFRVCRYGGSNR